MYKAKDHENQAKRSACETNQVTTTVRSHYSEHAETKYRAHHSKGLQHYIQVI